jgi:16S rRNA (guanine1516-N2)-methyltransferase
VKLAVVQLESDPSESSKQRCQLLAEKLQLPLLDIQQLRDDSLGSSCEHFLGYTDSVLALCSVESKQPAVLPLSVSVDFSDPKLNYRTKSAVKQQNIVKAIGAKGALRPTVLDGTAGLGKDAFLLASLGCEVLLLERSKIVHALLQDGLSRARNSNVELAAITGRMELLYTDFMKFTASEREFDVVYLDPMFPERKKSAKVKKDMALLQQLLGHESDNAKLLEHARKLAKKRVVVKRAKLSPHISSEKPDIEFKGSSSRFDVYLMT